jgi:predicted DNA-binding transcriptional regulator YafY
MQLRRKLARTMQALSLVRQEGLTVQEVAQVMQCSPRTIQRYLANPPS